MPDATIELSGGSLAGAVVAGGLAATSIQNEHIVRGPHDGNALRSGVDTRAGRIDHRRGKIAAVRVGS